MLLCKKPLLSVSRGFLNVRNASTKALVICGPSGVGKGTVIAKLLTKYPSMSLSVSHTTRKARVGEINGIHYYFVNSEQFAEIKENNGFVEFASVHGNFYGSSFEAISRIQQENKICVLDVDVQGVSSIKAYGKLDAHYIFIAPPSVDVLLQRLKDRGTETAASLDIRTRNATKELEYSRVPGNFDLIAVNDNLEECVKDIEKQLLVWYPNLI